MLEIIRIIMSWFADNDSNGMFNEFGGNSNNIHLLNQMDIVQDNIDYDK